MDDTNKKFNILIVDDASKNIQVVANILKQEGYQMAFARNGKTALSRAETMPFDLILLDIMMPEMDGYEACERLKKNPETKDIPVIFLTAKTDKESVLKGFGLGAVDYVTKPFNAAELLARVKTHLELKLAKEDLRNSRDQLQELNATKDKFFSIIAHDLRNPFNALISGSDMLVHYFEELEQEQIKEFIEEINLASRQAFNLLGNLLEWARSQTGRILYSPEKISMDEIVQKNKDLLEQNAKEKNIHLANDVEPDTFVYADKDMIATVIRNLMTNALKYTPYGGKVTITSKNAGDFTETWISDTGAGIGKEDMDKLFRIDTKYSTLGTANERGTGLGLILCKEFVKGNHGKIWVKSEVGKGSDFKFTLPKQIQE